MYLIDTDVLIWALRGNRTYITLLSNLRDQAVLSLSTITIAEIYKNIFPSEITKTEAVFDQFKIHPVTIQIARNGGLYWKQFVPKVKKINILDCLIAATAKESNATLVTLNLRHFPMKDIKVLQPD